MIGLYQWQNQLVSLLITSLRGTLLLSIALCCIDARDLSSNYSMQFNVSFDRYRNSIVKDLISPSGAPKPYPNFYLKGTLTEDVMKDSGHFRLSVFFDPEYLTVMDDNDDDFELLATNLNGGSL